ncbi:MAG: alpha/beta hydrolase, partial [Holophaga sp.]|nr:alpha/beta hydrolase [Holophaga sp.]
PLCHRFASAAYLEALLEGRREVLHLGHELDRPILLLEAGNDLIADPDASEELWSKVSPTLLSRHRLEGIKHEIFHDLRRSEALEILAPWLANIIPTQARNPRPTQATNV